MKKYINLMACFMLFTTPIFYSQLTIGSPDMRHQQWDCYAVFAILLLVMMIRNVWVSSFLLLSLGHFFFFHNPFSETHLFQTVVSALTFYVFSTYEIKNYKLALMALFLVNLGMAVVQHFGLDVYTWMTWSENGMLGLPAYLGILSAMATPILCTIHPVFFFLGLLGIFWSKSTFCVLAFSVAMAFYDWSVGRKRAFLVFVLCLLAIIPLARQDNHVKESSRRFPVWKMVASKAFRNPFLGWGMGSFDQQLIMETNKNGDRRYFQAKEVPENYPFILQKLEDISRAYGLNSFATLTGIHDKDMQRAIKNEVQSLKNNGVQMERWSSPHSHYLDVFFEYGFLGLFLLIGFIYRTLSCLGSRKTWLGKEELALYASFLALLVVSAVHFPLSVAKLNVVCMALVGILERKTEVR